jgi:hypothetical protein
MSWYPDLSNETLITSGPHVRAVGWLSSEHAYSTGDLPSLILEHIKTYCQHWGETLHALYWGLYMGFHTCELCEEFSSYGNVGLPAGELLYVFPEMLAHYVEKHQYLPPEEFIAALQTAPLPGTPEYYEAVASFREYERNRRREINKLAKLPDPESPETPLPG